MKEKILPFIIGFLVGAIITTAGFLVYTHLVSNNSSDNQSGEVNQPQDMPDGQTPPDMPEGDNQDMQGSDGEMGEPPAKPDQDDGSEPPAKPEDENNTADNN